MVPNASPHFETVSAQLELGGTLYLFADIDGDSEKAADFLLSVLRDRPELLELGAPHRLNPTTLVNVLGLDHARALGLSSYDAGGLYRNRGFIHAEQREGMLRMVSAEPERFEIVQRAPARTDLAWEQSLDLDGLLGTLEALSELGVGMKPQDLAAALDSPLTPLDLIPRALLEGLQTRMAVILAVDESRNLWIPGDSFMFPYIDFVVQIDGIEPLFDSLVRYADDDPFLTTRDSDTWSVVSPAIALPSPWNAYEPSLIKDSASGRVYLVSSSSFLRDCLSLTENVGTTSDFRRAMSGLPTEGNGLLYLSPKMTRVMHAALDRVVVAQGPAVQTQVARFLLPAAGEPYGWVLESRADGLLFTSNSASSHKSTLLMLGYAALLPAAFVLGAEWLEAIRDER